MSVVGRAGSGRRRKESKCPVPYPDPDPGPVPSGGEFVRNGRRYLRLISHDMVRDILVPSTQPPPNRALLCSEAFATVRRKAQVLEAGERVRQERQHKEESLKKAEESALRKKELQEILPPEKLAPSLDKLEREARKKAHYLLERAEDLKKEQADEIKYCNGLILSKKCQAIREAQIAEKQLIKKELEEEEVRVDRMMEMERRLALHKVEEMKREEAERREAFKAALRDQIRDNELEREILAERMEEEARIQNEAVMQMRLDDLQASKEKYKQKLKTRAEMRQINDDMIRLAEEERHESRVADLRVQECIRQKAEEEARREEEAERVRMEREKELAKMRATQEKAQDTKAKRDAQMAQRIQDEVERKWRKAEREAALKKEEEHRALRLERENQVEERRRRQAIELEEARNEVEALARLHRRHNALEKEQRLRKHADLEDYKMSLLKQINEKEKEKIKEKQAKFEEGLALEFEHKYREDELKRLMLRKLNEIRYNNIPDKYVKEIERKLQLTNH